MNFSFAGVKKAIFDLRYRLREDTVLGALFALVVLVPLLFNLLFIEQFDTVKYGVFGLCIGVGLVAFAYKAYEEGAQLFVASRIRKLFFIALGMFVLWSFVVTVVSVDRINSLVGFYYRFANSLLFHFIWACFVGLLVCTKPISRVLLLKTATFTGILVAVWGILQSSGFGFYVFSEAAFLRAPSFLGNANFSSMYVAALVPLCIYFAVKELGVLRYLYVVSAFIMLWSIVLTSSRGALAGVVVSIVSAGFIGLVLPRARKVVVGLSLISGVVISVFLFGFLGLSRPQALKTTLSFSDTNISSRLYMWDLSADSIVRRPLFGVGLGNFLYIFERERGSNFASEVSFFDDAHNWFLHWGVTGGIPLLVLYCVMIGMAFWGGVHHVRKGDAESIALMAGLCALLVAGSFTPVTIPNYLLLGLFIAYLVKSDTGHELKPLTRKWKRSIQIIGICICIWAVTFLLAEFFGKAGRDAYYKGDYSRSKTLLNVAVTLNPTSPYFKLFRAAGSVKANEPTEKQLKRIQEIENQHPAYSRASMWEAHLYALRFYQTQSKEDLEKVGIYLDQAIQRDKYSKYYRYLRAQYYVLSNRFEDAEKETKQLLSLNPEYADAWLLLAKVYQLQGDAEGFRTSLSEAYKLRIDYEPMRILWKHAKDAKDIRFVPLDIVSLLGEI